MLDFRPVKQWDQINHENEKYEILNQNNLLDKFVIDPNIITQLTREKKYAELLTNLIIFWVILQSKDSFNLYQSIHESLAEMEGFQFNSMTFYTYLRKIYRRKKDLVVKCILLSMHPASEDTYKELMSLNLTSEQYLEVIFLLVKKFKIVYADITFFNKNSFDFIINHILIAPGIDVSLLMDTICTAGTEKKERDIDVGSLAATLHHQYSKIKKGFKVINKPGSDLLFLIIRQYNKLIGSDFININLYADY